MQLSAVASVGTETSPGAEGALSLDHRGSADTGGQPELSSCSEGDGELLTLAGTGPFTLTVSTG